MPRLFFALQPEPGQKLEIARSVQPWLKSPGGKAVPAPDLHLTLCFLGEVPQMRIAALLEAAAGIQAQRLQLRLSRIDHWRAARVLCLLAPEEDAGVQAAARLAGQLRAAARDIGLQLDARPFRAHVTVARKVPAGMTGAGAWPQELVRPLPFHANGFALMESRPDSAGPRYSVYREWLA